MIVCCKSVAAGGTATVCDPPNCDPPLPLLVWPDVSTLHPAAKRTATRSRIPASVTSGARRRGLVSVVFRVGLVGVGIPFIENSFCDAGLPNVVSIRHTVALYRQYICNYRVMRTGKANVIRLSSMHAYTMPMPRHHLPHTKRG